jgi:hypothetical protein
MLELITPRPAQSGKYKSDAAPPAQDPTNGEPATHFEAPTKIRYPTKRMTIGEMRKRVRNLLEFVGRVQGEEDKRGERAKLLELGVASAGSDQASEVPAKAASEEKKSENAVEVPADSMDVDHEPEAVVENKADQNIDAKKEEAAVEDQPTPMNVDEAVASAPAAESAQAGEKPTTDDTTNGDSSQSTNLPPPAEASDDKTTPERIDTVKSAAPEPAEPSNLPVEESTVPPPSAPEATSQPPQSKSSQLLAELTSDLIRFQMMFEVGGSVFAAPQGMNGGEEE